MAVKAKTGYHPPRGSWKKDFKANWVVYLLFLPIFLYQIIFHYIPMFGIVMAFEDFKVSRGYFGSRWVGFQNFIELFTGEAFPRALRNTICMGLLNLTVGFVLPIIFALLLSMLKSRKYKRTVQTFSYMPNFVSAVVTCALVKEFLDKDGALTLLLGKFGLEAQNWLANDQIPVFWLINLFTGVWCGIGWGSIMYVASIATINGDLHEAAAIDGANRFQRMLRITVPCIMPMIVMMFTLQIGLVFVMGFDKVLLLYMPSTYNVADCLHTYTYRMAFGGGNSSYSLSAASGLFQSVMGTVLLVGSNYLNRKVSGMSLF